MAANRLPRRTLLILAALAALLADLASPPTAAAQRAARGTTRTNVNSGAQASRGASANRANANSGAQANRSANANANRNVNQNANVNRNTNVNRNVNVNQNVNVNRDVNVDVDNDWNDWDNDGWDHPVAAGMAVGAAAALTAAAIGSMVYSLPPSCSSVVVNGIAYQQCGGTWYQPQYAGSQVTYIVVNSPQ